MKIALKQLLSSVILTKTVEGSTGNMNQTLLLSVRIRQGSSLGLGKQYRQSK